MSALELILSLVSDEKMDELIEHLSPETRQAIELLFAPEPPPIPGSGCPPKDFRRAKTVEKQAGRLEERKITVSNLLNDYVDWHIWDRSLCWSDGSPAWRLARLAVKFNMG